MDYEKINMQMMMEEIYNTCKVGECIKKDFNDLINEVAKKYIEENIRLEYKKYLPFSYSSGSIK